MSFDVVTHQVFILIILGLIGVIASKTGLINEPVKQGLSGIIFNITLPLLILNSLSDMELTGEVLFNSLLVILFSFLALALLYLTGTISSRIMSLNRRATSIHVIHTMFGNIVFLGFPLIHVLFGNKGLLFAMLFHLCSNTMQWTFGVYLLAAEQKQNILAGLKKLINPNTLAFFLGLILMSLDWSIPVVFKKSLGGLGNTSLYLSMLYIGAVLSETTIQSLIGKFRVFILSINKLILSPVLILLIISAILNITGLEMDAIALSVIIMQSAMPCMVIIIIMAKKYGADDVHASQNVLTSTLLSVFTLPIILLLLEKIL
ncbi:MAG: AEC family transporter [Bacteroidales bacterium]|nr:AEC family transporter [Bacteroidales bacterium]